MCRVYDSYSAAFKSIVDAKTAEIITGATRTFVGAQRIFESAHMSFVGARAPTKVFKLTPLRAPPKALELTPMPGSDQLLSSSCGDTTEGVGQA